MKRKEITEEKVLVSDLSSTVGESYQRLLTNIELNNVDESIKVIGFTSSVANEGTASTIANLAHIYSLKGKKVLIFDLDLRRPSIHFFFQKPNELGIVDYVLGECKKDDIIKHSDLGVDFVCTGKDTVFPTEIIESKVLAKLIEETREKYDYIFINIAPVLTGADLILLSTLIDGLILIIKSNYATKDMLNETIKQIKNTKVKLIGSVLTNMNPKDCGFYTYDEYKK